MKQLNFGRDIQGFNAYAPVISDINYSATIASGAHKEVTVPSSSQNWIIVFQYQFGSDIWVAINNTAAQPAGATFAATTSVLTPAQLHVQAGDIISCYNNNASGQDVGISFYAIP